MPHFKNKKILPRRNLFKFHALRKMWEATLYSKSVLLMFLNFATHKNSKISSLQILLKIYSIYVMNNMNVFHDKINYYFCESTVALNFIFW